MHGCGCVMCRHCRRAGKGSAALLTKRKGLHTCGPLRCSNCDTYTCHCQGFGNLGGKGATFWTGTAAPVVAPLTPSRRRAHTVEGLGIRNCGIMAAASVPQSILSFHHRRSCLLVPGTYLFLHGRQVKWGTLQGTNHCRGWRHEEGTVWVYPWEC